MDAIVYDKVGKEAEKVREALYGIYPQETITDAAIVSFDDGADGIPVKALTVGIEPVQDLHGYDNPWPAGGGKNKLKNNAQTTTVNGVTFTVNSDGTVTANGTASGSATIEIARKSNNGALEGNYYLNGCPSGGGSGKYTMSIWRTNYGAVSDTGNGTELLAFSASTDYIINATVANGYTANNLVFKPMIRLATEADSTFAPYSNICPISGWTGAEIERTGVNVWDEEWENGTFNTTTGANINTGAAANQIRAKNLIPIKPSATYYFKGPSGIWCIFYDANKNVITPPSYDENVIGYDGNSLFLGDSARPASVTFTMPSNVYFMKFYCQNVYGSTYNNDISINYPATDTEYHPYTGNQISVTFPAEAGTVYGGTLTINPDRTGTLRIMRGSFICDNTSFRANAVEIRGTTFYFFSRAIGNIKKPINNQIDPTWISAEQYSTTRSTAIVGAPGKISLQTNGTLLISTGQPTDSNVLPSGRVTYELDSPVDIPITATEVSGVLTTLYGQNNIWADTGNIEKLTYRADLGKYIDSHITTAIANALNA